MSFGNETVAYLYDEWRFFAEFNSHIVLMVDREWVIYLECSNKICARRMRTKYAKACVGVCRAAGV